MDYLKQYRDVLVEVECPTAERPITWEQPTTRTDEELRVFALRAAATVCADQGAGHCWRHRATISEIPQVSTGARRG